MIDQPYVFDLAAKKSQWLAVRQVTIASNVANANTPGYQASDVSPFTKVLDSAALSMSVTDPGHMAVNTSSLSARSPRQVAASSWDVSPSGNSVSVEQEMAKAGELSKDYSLTTGIMRSMQRIWLMGVKA